GEPARERVRRTRDPPPLQIGNVANRRFRADSYASVEWRPGHRRDRHDRRPLSDESHVRTGIETNIEATRCHGLLQPPAAAEGGNLDVEVFLMEEALANADIEQRKGKCLRHRFADAQLLVGARPE